MPLFFLIRLAAAFAPYVAKLGVFWPPLPFLSLGSFAVAAAASSVLLPETAGKGMMEAAAAASLEEKEDEEEVGETKV